MNAGDADKRRRQFDFDGAGIDVSQPIRPIRMMFKIQFADKCRIAADYDHGQEIGHHRNVDQPQDSQHEDRLFHLMNMGDHFPEFDQEFVCVEQLRHDEPGIQRGLNPSAGEDHHLKCVFDNVAGSMGGF